MRRNYSYWLALWGALLFGIEARGQLPIYPDWERTYELEGNSRYVNGIVVLPFLRQSIPSHPDALIACFRANYQDWHTPMELNQYLVGVDSAGIFMRAEWHHSYGVVNDWCSNLVQLESGFVALVPWMYYSHRVEAYDTSGQRAWASPFMGVSELVRADVGDIGTSLFCAWRWEGGARATHVISLDGQDVRRIEEEQISLTNPRVAALPNNKMLFCGTAPDSGGLALKVIDTTGTTLRDEDWEFTAFAPFFRNGFLYILARSAQSELVLQKRDTIGVLVSEVRFHVNNLWNSSALFATSDDVLVLPYQTRVSDTTYHHLMYASMDSDSLGSIVVAPNSGNTVDGRAYAADEHGGLFVVYKSGTGFRIHRLSPTPTPASDVPSLPEEFDVSVFPNPFNSQATFRFGLPDAGSTELKVYDITGRLVKILVDGYRQAGSYEFHFDATGLASGIYIYSFTSGGFAKFGKLALVR
ncbi:T9SS type A sorting domain-containing protein [bacterium]|nr:T9SS type A sorting domain-containing protein [bacterium]